MTVSLCGHDNSNYEQQSSKKYRRLRVGYREQTVHETKQNADALAIMPIRHSYCRTIISVIASEVMTYDFIEISILLLLLLSILVAYMYAMLFVVLQFITRGRA